jgi:cation:H+ antiporter
MEGVRGWWQGYNAVAEERRQRELLVRCPGTCSIHAPARRVGLRSGIIRSSRSVILSALWLVVGGVLLYLGAEALIRGAVALAFRAGMTPLVVGLTVVAAGTSTPEMVVSVLSTLRGQGAIAIGNVVGSNVCNILLIAGTAALIRPMTVQHTVVRREIPIMIGVSLLTGALLWWQQGLVRPEAALLVVLLVASTVWSIRAARQEGISSPTGEVAAGPQRSVGVSLLLLGVGLALLVVGADRFVTGAVDLARTFGLSEAVIGLTVVAIGTSLPELATSVVAALKGESDIALGNVVGSNIFNLLGILGVTGLVQPLLLPPGSGLDLLVMIATAMLVLPLARSGLRLHRWEGAVLLGLYGVYVAWLLAR